MSGSQHNEAPGSLMSNSGQRMEISSSAFTGGVQQKNAESHTVDKESEEGLTQGSQSGKKFLSGYTLALVGFLGKKDDLVKRIEECGGTIVHANSTSPPPDFQVF